MKRKGNAAIILVVAFTALLGFTALALDIGNVYINKVKLSNALDAAALSACLELPENPSKASIIAYEYLEKNGIDPSRTTISISDNNKQVEIEGDLDVEYFLQRQSALKEQRFMQKQGLP
ncbi:Tad domain-containing protein [Caloramator sp. Dgby_cultured_2]|uniref:Tad domain-containing protein n=1 Tax=Caloramator sp. Dgby_cultured_2 TaxID=3029174 RepID=UPI00237E683D|nr:Tad domain-containing protein [Caloramator sp. Dgby_cultured_2]WDU82742.1 Tad domain-containing protein [Caloramator sp. Dgby_cultured_2]